MHVAEREHLLAARRAGKLWRAYVEDLPENCSTDSTDLYVPDHNPPIYYGNISGECAKWDVPMGSLETGALHDDLVNGTLPDYSFLTPNLRHDTHECDLAVGDRWRAGWMAAIVAGPTYQAGGTVIFIVWDDSNQDPPGVDDCTKLEIPDCLVPFVVVSRSTPAGTHSSTTFSHFSLLRTTEGLLGLDRFLGGAASAPSLRSAFNL